VAADTSGNVAAIWVQSDCVASFQVWSRRWTVSGGWTNAERVDSRAEWALAPEIAIDSNDNVVAVWKQDGDAGFDVTWSNRWTPGEGWGTPERIQATDSFAMDPQVNVDADGNAIATWRERNADNVYGLWLNRWTPGGGWGTPERIELSHSVGKYQMAVDPNGHALAVWAKGIGNVSSDYGLWSARWTGAWETPVQLANNGVTREPKVALDADGNAFATWMYWQGGAPTGGARIWANRWTPTEGWGENTQLHGIGSSGRCDEVEGTCRDGWAWDPALAVDPSGNALVTWVEAENDAQGLRRDTWVRRYTPGEGWAPAERLDREELDVSAPEATFDADGNAIVVWPQASSLWMSRYEQGCGDGNPDGAGGQGGVVGTGGIGGAVGTDPCEGVVCPNTECKTAGVCNPSTGVCDYESVAEDGTACSEGACLEGGCGRVGAFPCTEQGIRDAVTVGGGPHYFACDSATRPVVEAIVEVDNDVILDGEGEMVIDAGEAGLFLVQAGIAMELRAIEVEPSGTWFGNFGTVTLIGSTVPGISNQSGGTLTVIDSEVRGWGIRNNGDLSLTRTTVAVVPVYEPWYELPAGVTNWGSGTMTLTDCVVVGGHNWDGGIANHGGVALITRTTVTGHMGVISGAIWNSGMMTIVDSTASGNTGSQGPAIYNSSDLTLINSTVSGNDVVVTCGSRSNGYALGNSGTLTLTNSTVSGHENGSLQNRGVATITNSVIDGSCLGVGSGASTASGGYNVMVGADECGFDHATDVVGVSAEELELGPLTDNGGVTQTHALLPGSVAIDLIPAPMCEVANDQRGEPRPAGGMCDVGAFEVQP